MNCNTYFGKKINIHEAICLMETKINEIVDAYNRVDADHKVIAAKVKELEALIDYLLGAGLAAEVKKQLEVWLADGTLAGIINEAIFKDLNDKVNSALLKLTQVRKRVEPEQFGAIGNGVADDTEAFKKMCEAIEDFTDVNLGKNKVYAISESFMLLTKNYININGNGSTIKILDDSGILAKIRDEQISRDLISLRGNNIEISNLKFNGNVVNNYILSSNGDKVHGSHPDIDIPGIPKKQIFYNALDAIGSNIKILNCVFEEVAGGAINIGNTSYEKSKNIEVKSCVVNKCFRGAVSFFNTDTVIVEGCEFNHNQRHNIQFYTGNVNGTAIGNKAIVDVTQIPKWYPTWSINAADAETTGISIGHVYNDLNRNFTIKNNYFVSPLGIKNGIAIRNYVENVSIEENTLRTLYQAIFLTSGIRGVYNIRNNKILRSETGIKLVFNKSNTPPIEPKEVEGILNIIDNEIFGYAANIALDKTTEAAVRACYKSLKIRLEDNFFIGGEILKLENQLPSIPTSKVVDIVFNGNTFDSGFDVASRRFNYGFITIGAKNDTIIISKMNSNGYVKLGEAYCKYGESVSFQGSYKTVGISRAVVDFNTLIRVAGDKNITVSFAINKYGAGSADAKIAVAQMEDTGSGFRFVVYAKVGTYIQAKLDKSGIECSTGMVTYNTSLNSLSSITGATKITESN